MTNNIKRLEQLLSNLDYQSSDEIISYLCSIQEKISKDGFSILSDVETSKLLSYLSKASLISEREYTFLMKFSGLQQISKAFLITQNLFDDDEREYIRGLSSKIDSSVSFYEKKKDEVNPFDILRKLNKGNTNLITGREIDYVTSLLFNINLTLEDKISILDEINTLNCEVYNKYDTNEVKEVNSVFNLKTTNLDELEINEVFKKYGILFQDLNANSKALILNYGNVQNIENVLSFLKENGILDLVIKTSDILARTLVLSDTEKLNEVKERANFDNISLRSLVSKIPSVLYPPIKGLKMKGMKEDGNRDVVTGSLINYLENSKELEKRGISSKKAFDNCPLFFSFSHKNVEYNFSCLDFYGFNNSEDNYSNANFLSILSLGKGKILEGLDYAIESNAFDYVREHLTVISSLDSLKLIKLARQKGLSDNDIFHEYANVTRKKCIRRKSLCELLKLDGSNLGEQIEASYSVFKPEFENGEELSNILAMGSNDSISEAIFSDDKVKRLELYKSNTNDYEYNFNGVIISRQKVLRYYDTLRKNGKTGDDSLLFAATFNSMLDENEFEAVKSCIEDVLVRRKK